VIKKTLNPSFPEKYATFDFNIYLSLVDKLSAIELIAWDKDTIGKDYLGEASLPLEDWFQYAPEGREYAWEAIEVSQPDSSHPARSSLM
jgi:hypothetical protein